MSEQKRTYGIDTVAEINRKQVNYTVACIHEFANRNRMSQQAAYEYLRKYQGIAFLSEHYEIEHTLSMDDALNDMLTICRNNGGQTKESRRSEMSKAEMLMEYATQDIVSWIMKDEHVNMTEALDRFYTSTTFEKLSDVETGLYLDAPASIYSLYQDERAAGKFVQNEI